MQSDEAAVAKLRDLTPPEADRNRIAAMLANFERGLGKGVGDPHPAPAMTPLPDGGRGGPQIPDPGAAKRGDVWPE
jgi:hypothetical protein